MNKKISLDKKIDNLTKTVEDLALATAKGFANTVTKKDLEEKLKDYPTKDDTEMMLSRHIGFFRRDYDELTSRVKKLETAVFKR